MRTINFLSVAFAAFVLFAGCTKSPELGAPSVSVNATELSFEKAGGAQNIELTATRDWKAVVDDKLNWISVEPKEGKGSSSAQTVKITLLENKGVDREAVVKFDIGLDSKIVTVKQKGSGSAEELIVYKNNFDKAKAEKKKWGGSTYDNFPLLDQFDGWHNWTGKGIANVDHAFRQVSLRTNSHHSASQDSDYSGSGLNSLWFGKDSYFMVKNLDLQESRDYILSFGAIRNEYKSGETIDNTFKPAEFKVYISDNGSKWVELSYAFPNGFKNKKWDLASSKFTVAAGVKKLFICVKPSYASAYALDDLSLEKASEAGTVIDFSKGIDLGIAGSGETVKGKLAEIIAAPDGANVETSEEVLVVAESKQSILVSDGKDYLLIHNKEAGVKGDKVVVSGVKSTYGGFAQIGSKDKKPTVTVKSQNNTVTLPAVKEIADAQFDSYAWDKIEMVSFTGKLSVSGAFYNVTVNGATKIGSIVAPLESLVPSTANGKTIKVTGFFVGKTGQSSQYINIIATSAEISGEGPVAIDPSLLTSNITWANVENSWDNEKVQINNASEQYQAYKLGLSPKDGNLRPGKAKVTLPKGTKKVHFFAVGWKGEGGTTLSVKFGILGIEIGSQKVRENVGASGTSPYKLIVDPAKDRYSITLQSPLDSDTEVSLTTKDGGARVILFGIQAVTE